MPHKSDPPPNGQKPPESLHFERKPVICKGCRRTFKHFIIEEIDDLVQLRIDDLLITKIETACLHCGDIFYWNAREKDLGKMAVKYGELIVVINGYNPE